VGIWSAMGNLCRDLYVMLTFTRWPVLWMSASVLQWSL
jgi:hypothetical protein